MPPKKAAGAPKTKKVSPYNAFMKEELARLKKNGDTRPHKELFKAAAAAWKTSPKNPKAVK